MNKTNSRIGNIVDFSGILKVIPESQLLVEAAIRRGVSITELIKPTTPSQAKISLAEWKYALASWQNVYYPDYNPMYRIFDNIRIDLLLSANIETRILRVQQAKFNLVDENNKPDEEAKKLLQKQWFLDFIRHHIDSKMEGFRLAELIYFDDNKELTECKAINKYHLKPHKGIWVTQEFDQTGTSYLEPPFSPYYLPLGDPDAMGLLFKVAPIILAIKYAIGHWCEYDEKLGIPFRTVTTNAADSKRQQQLAVIMTNMGSAGWAVLNEGEKVELMQNAGTNPTQCFENLINMLDARVATYLLGQSSTVSSDKNKGTYGSLQVLQEVTEMVHESDLTSLQYLLNSQLFPKLVLLSPVYTPLGKLRISWDQSIEHTPAEIVGYVTQLETNFEVDPEWITQKTGIPIIGRKSAAIAPPPPANKPPANVPPKKKSPVNSMRLQAYYEVGCCTGNTIEAAVPSFDAIVTKVAKTIFDGKQKGVLNKELYQATADYLLKGILSGFKPVTEGSDTNDVALLKKLEDNVHVFSGFKTYEQLRAITDLLTDGNGVVRTWPEFKKEVLNVSSKYNVTYLRAEYDNAVVSASQAAYWDEIQRNKQDLPYLKFVATLDDRTTQTCRTLDGVIRKADDDFWKTYFLPLHWKERSLIQQLPTGKETNLNDIILPELQDMFKQNVGISGAAFPDTHPYYDVKEAEKKKVLKELKNFKQEE